MRIFISNVLCPRPSVSRNHLHISTPLVQAFISRRYDGGKRTTGLCRHSQPCSVDVAVGRVVYRHSWSGDVIADRRPLNGRPARSSDPAVLSAGGASRAFDVARAESDSYQSLPPTDLFGVYNYGLTSGELHLKN